MPLDRVPGQSFNALVGRADRRGRLGVGWRRGPVLAIGLLFLIGSTTPLSISTSAWAQKAVPKRQIEARPIPGPPRGLPAVRVHQAEPSPAEPGRVYSATAQGLFVSDDGGESWNPLLVDGTHDEVFSVAVHPTVPGVVYAGRRDGLWQSPDGGQSWTPLAYPTPEAYIPLAVVIAEGQPTIYMATARQGVYRSADGGNRWASASNGLPEARAGGRAAEIRTLVVNPQDADTAYIAHERHGVYRTTDGGASWHRFADGLRLPFWSSTYPPQLTFDPDDPSRLFLLFGQRIHSHLVQNRLYVTSRTGAWLPVEVDLPANTAFVGLTVDQGTQALLFWAQDAVWEFPLPGQP